MFSGLCLWSVLYICGPILVGIHLCASNCQASGWVYSLICSVLGIGFIRIFVIWRGIVVVSPCTSTTKQASSTKGTSLFTCIVSFPNPLTNAGQIDLFLYRVCYKPIEVLAILPKNQHYLQQYSSMQVVMRWMSMYSYHWLIP